MPNPNRYAELRSPTLEEMYGDDSIRQATIWDSPIGQLLASFMPQQQVSFTPPDASVMDTSIERIRKLQNAPGMGESALTLGMGASPFFGAISKSEKGLMNLARSLLRRWYEQDIPSRGGLRSLNLPATWKRYETLGREKGTTATPEGFRELFTDLLKNDLVEMSPHSMTSEMSAIEKEISPTTRFGEPLHYWYPKEGAVFESPRPTSLPKESRYDWLADVDEDLWEWKFSKGTSSKYPGRWVRKK